MIRWLKYLYRLRIYEAKRIRSDEMTVSVVALIDRLKGKEQIISIGHLSIGISAFKRNDYWV